jgi:hypothetical protein
VVIVDAHALNFALHNCICARSVLAIQSLLSFILYMICLEPRIDSVCLAIALPIPFPLMWTEHGVQTTWM